MSPRCEAACLAVAVASSCLATLATYYNYLVVALVFGHVALGALLYLAAHYGVCKLGKLLMLRERIAKRFAKHRPSP